ncbi:hypothetical protein COI53_25670 [Bacillus thuringiensis]|uniref:hypothetical protein n=1 Tax=Bacillus thuringiensis TaxID=1428 RepID=UPI000BF8378B|nr:hypothetical protein [Bacillus thuringiensis]PFI27087.1 hypothetical protein COI53_25670 [Bacillus thuringiensis]
MDINNNYSGGKMEIFNDLAGFKFNDDVANILLKIADILISLQTWIDSKTYKPNNSDSLPWRKNEETLNAEKFELISYLEPLIRETSYEVFLLNRWLTIQEDPFSFTPIKKRAMANNAWIRTCPNFRYH